ncbi:MAG: hypothetical protein AABZ49_01590, partial [Thermoproteota archaeon]
MDTRPPYLSGISFEKWKSFRRSFDQYKARGGVLQMKDLIAADIKLLLVEDNEEYIIQEINSWYYPQTKSEMVTGLRALKMKELTVQEILNYSIEFMDIINGSSCKLQDQFLIDQFIRGLCTRRLRDLVNEHDCNTVQEVRMVALQVCRDALQHIAASNGWNEDRTPKSESRPVNNHKHRPQPAQPVPSQSTLHHDQFQRSASTVVNRHEQKESFSTPRRATSKSTSQPKPWKRDTGHLSRESPQAKTV